ncbi:MAG: SPFH domain-containing protein [Prevotellaceae bacterium]|jgi:membrane protease subunit (stomatin/prohibitin family)|nr:SPFH domain-containing protein [Prevotellaceae bacterium]
MGLLNRNWDGKNAGSPDNGIFGSTISRDHESDDEMVWKYSFSNVKKGAKIFVKPTQRAILLINNEYVSTIEGGQTFDLYDSSNIPLLGGVLNFATGGETPYPVDIWFVNVETHRNMLWATGKMHVRDWETNIPAELYCNGSCVIKIKDVELFYKTYIGTKHGFSVTELYDNMRNIIKEEVIVHILGAIEKDHIPLYDFQGNMRKFSTEIEVLLQSEAFDERGIELIKFAIGEVDFSEEFKEAIKELRTKEKFYSSEAYLRKEQFEIMKQAAANPGAGVMMGVGMGAGMGAGMGQSMGSMMQNAMGSVNQQNVPPPPLPAQIYAVINGIQSGPLSLDALQSNIQQGLINKDTLVWKQGMTAWVAAASLPELSALLGAVPPPLPPV